MSNTTTTTLPTIFEHGTADDRDNENRYTPPNISLRLTKLYLHLTPDTHKRPNVESESKQQYKGFNHLLLDKQRDVCGYRWYGCYACQISEKNITHNNFIDLYRLDKGNKFGRTVQRVQVSDFWGPVYEILIKVYAADQLFTTPRTIHLFDACSCKAFYELWKHIPGADKYIEDYSTLWIDDNVTTQQIRQIIRCANHIFKLFSDSPIRSPYRMTRPYKQYSRNDDILPAIIFELDDYAA